MARSIHQLLPVFSYGDAIGGATLRIRALLRELGYRSEIFAGLVDPRLRREGRSASHLLEPAAVRPDDAVIYHLSVGSPVTSLFEQVPCHRLMWFHNITPSSYYRVVNPTVAYWTERGEQELARLAPLMETVLAPSRFNLDEAIAAGAQRGAVVPVFDVDRLRPRANTPTQPPTVLFVGRVAPNKRHETLIRALAVLRATTCPDARLRMVGSADDCKPYLDGLRLLVGRLGLTDAVDLRGQRASNEEVSKAYATASVYASASEHEGFCVPVLEAMAFGLPVVALAAGAVPETVGAAGLLLDTSDALVWAEALGRLIGDPALRASLAAAGRLRVGRFTESVVRSQLARALADASL
ncbi:MAG: glycosyltransferase family 4 protein [Candidatus Dormibacteria bacterium]